MEVGYINSSFQLFKVKFRQTLLSYVVFPFFISMHVHDLPENVKRHVFDENNVTKHTTFCDVGRLFKERSKSTNGKVTALTSNEIEYFYDSINVGKFW